MNQLAIILIFIVIGYSLLIESIKPPMPEVYAHTNYELANQPKNTNLELAKETENKVIINNTIELSENNIEELKEIIIEKNKTIDIEEEPEPIKYECKLIRALNEKESKEQAEKIYHINQMYGNILFKSNNCVICPNENIYDINSLINIAEGMKLKVGYKLTPKYCKLV